MIEEDRPYVCPTCYAVAPDRCAAWCYDPEGDNRNDDDLDSDDDREDDEEQAV